MYAIVIAYEGKTKPVISNGKETIAELFYKAYKRYLYGEKIKKGWKTVSEDYIPQPGDGIIIK